MVEDEDGKAQPSRQLSTETFLNMPVCLCVYPSGLRVSGVRSTLSAVLHEWRNSSCGTVAQIKEKNNKKKKRKKEARTDQHSIQHGSTGCRHRFFTVTFLEDKVELNNTSSLSHISLETYTAPPKCVSTDGDLMQILNKCAIVVTVCALTDTTDCNWDVTSTSFTKRRRL